MLITNSFRLVFLITFLAAITTQNPTPGKVVAPPTSATLPSPTSIDVQHQPSLVTKLNDLVNYMYNGFDFLAYGQINITLAQGVGQAQQKSDIKDLKHQLSELKAENTLLKSSVSAMQSQIGLMSKGVDKLVKAMSECEPTWHPFQNRCYKFVATVINADESRKECGIYGSQLATVRSRQHNDFIASMAPSSVWIGLKRAHGSFSWPEGTAVWYRNFHPGYPRSGQVCVFIDKSDKQWRTMPCSYTAGGYVCEKPL